MPYTHVIWDLEEDPDGNVRHIAEHGVTVIEVTKVLENPQSQWVRSRASDNRIVFGWTETGKHLAVVYQHVQDDPPTAYPITAYETPPQAKRRRK